MHGRGACMSGGVHGLGGGVAGGVCLHGKGCVCVWQGGCAW